MGNYFGRDRTKERTESIPKNRWRTFEVELPLPVYEKLRIFHEEFGFGITIDITAEAFFCEWIRSRLVPGQKNDALWEKVRNEGYLPQSEKRRYYPELFGVVHVDLGGMPRYFVEHVSRAKPSLLLTNPFYQQTSEKIIAKVLEYQVARKMKEYQKRGLIDEDDLS